MVNPRDQLGNSPIYGLFTKIFICLVKKNCFFPKIVTLLCLQWSHMEDSMNLRLPFSRPQVSNNKTYPIVFFTGCQRQPNRQYKNQIRYQLQVVLSTIIKWPYADLFLFLWLLEMSLFLVLVLWVLELARWVNGKAFTKTVSEEQCDWKWLDLNSRDVNQMISCHIYLVNESSG